MLNEPATADALRRLRELSGLSRRVAARQMGMDKRALRSWEEGRTTPDHDQIDRATRIYGRGLDWLLTDREPITNPAEPGIIRVGLQSVDIAEIRREHPGIHDANRAILNAYVDAVRSVRGIPVKGIVELRSLDIRLLSKELDISDPEIGDLLADVFNMTPAGAQAATRAVLIGSLLAVTAAGVIGGTWFAPTASASASAAPAPVAATAQPAQPASPAQPATGPIFTTSPFGAVPPPPNVGAGPFGSLNDDSLGVFSVSPRDVSQQSDSASDSTSPASGQGLQALPAGSPQLPES